jgi:hypothetical protein
VQWNLAKKGGWNRYEILSNECADKLDEAIEDERKDVEEVMETFEKIHTKVKFRSFGKVNTAKKKAAKEDKPEDSKGQETEEEKAKELLQKQVEDVEKEIEEIRRKKKGTVGTIYEVAKRVRGGKKVPMQPSAIQNPETGKLVVSRTQIKSVTLKYCKETLSNNPPKPGFERHADIQEELQKLRMNATNGHFMANKELFEKVLNKFKSSSKHSYDFLTKAGGKFQNSCYKMCDKMFQLECFPGSFKDTILHMIFKGKGKKEELSCNRFIHCKSWLPRLAEACLVEGGIKKHMVEESSRFQVGGQAGTGRRSCCSASST